MIDLILYFSIGIIVSASWYPTVLQRTFILDENKREIINHKGARYKSLALIILIWPVALFATGWYYLFEHDFG